MCKEEGLKIPYEKCGPEIAPSVTGNAIVQHLAKLRKKMEAEIESSEDEGGDGMKKGVKDDSSNASYTPDSNGVSKRSIGKRGPKHNIKKGEKKEVMMKKKKKKAETTGEESIKKDHTEGSTKKGRQHTAWSPKEGDSETDGDEYVAAGSSFVGRDEDITEEDVSDAVSASSASEDGQGSKIVILRLPKEKYRLHMQTTQLMEDSLHGISQETEVADVTGSLPAFGPDDAGSGFISNVANPGQQLLMSGSAGIPAQPHQTIGTTGMYDFNPTPFVDQTAGYTPNMMYAPGSDATIQYPYAGLFAGPDPGFMDMDMAGYNPFDADFKIASGDHTDIHAAGSNLASFDGARDEAMALIPANPSNGVTKFEIALGNHNDIHATGPNTTSLDGTQAETMVLVPAHPSNGFTSIDAASGNHTNPNALGPYIISVCGAQDEAMALVPATSGLATTAKPAYRRHCHRRTLTFIGSERFGTNEYGRIKVTGHTATGGRFVPLNTPPSVHLPGIKDVRYNEPYHEPHHAMVQAQTVLRLKNETDEGGDVVNVSKIRNTNKALTNLSQYMNTGTPHGRVEEGELD